MSNVTTCSSCPAFLPPERVATELGQSYGINVSVCGHRGIPLGHVRSSDEQRQIIWSEMASSCNHKSKPLPPKFSQTAGEVGVTSVFINPQDRETTPAVTNCSACAYYVEASKVHTELGWNVPLCAARAVLIPGRLGGRMAKNCQLSRSRHGAPPEASLETFKVYPVYGDAKIRDFRTQPAVSRMAGVEVADPRFVESDIDVSDEDAEMGIRAWKVLRHPLLPDRKEPVYMPIFDEKYFTDEEREQIPQMGDDRYHPELYNDYMGATYKVLVNLLGVERSPILIGPAGTGKTEFFAYLAWQMQLPFERIQITQETEVADIMGQTHVTTDPVSGASITEWEDGLLPKRIVRPGVVCIDEPNTGQPAMWQAIRPLLDNAAELVVPGNRNRKYRRHEWCMLGFAMNPAWDARYIGTGEISEADGNRTGAVWFDFPDEDTEKDIIISKVENEGFTITNGQLDALMSIAKELRQLASPEAGSELTISLSVRVQTTVALLWRYLTLAEAYMVAMGDRLDPQQRQQILTVVNNYTDAANE